MLRIVRTAQSIEFSPLHPVYRILSHASRQANKGKDMKLTCGEISAGQLCEKLVAAELPSTQSAPGVNHERKASASKQLSEVAVTGLQT